MWEDTAWGVHGVAFGFMDVRRITGLLIPLVTSDY